MRKHFFVLFISCLAAFTCLSKQLPDLSPKDSVGLLLELAKIKMDTEPAGSVCLAQRAYDYAKQADFNMGQADASFLLGKAHCKLHDATQAITAFEQAAVSFRKEKEPVKEGISYHGLANVYIYELNNYTKGFQYSKKALELLHGDSTALQPVLGNLAALYLQTKRPDQALSLFQQIYTYWQKRNKLAGMANALNNIATVYEEKKEYKQSIIYYKKAIDINRSLKAYPSLCTTLLGLATTYCHINEHEKSEQLLAEVQGLAQLHRITTLNVQAFQFLAEEKMHRGDSKAALQFSLKAYELSQKNGLTVFNTVLFEQLSRLYKTNGDMARAFDYQQKYISLKDSTRLEERIALAESVDQFSSSLAEVPLLMRTKTLLITLFALLVFAGGVIYVKKKKSPDQLNQPIFNLDNDKHPEEEVYTSETSSPPTPPVVPKLEVIHGEGVKLLSLQSVWWFQKEGKNYHAFTESENYRVKQNISELEEALPKGKFFRVNRAAIINTSFMSNYSFWENHKYIIRMKDEKKSSFTISRNRLRELKDTLQQLSEN